MRRKGIEEEMMTESFEREQRTFDERIITSEILVVPNKLTLKRGRSDNETHPGQDQTAHPVFAQGSAKRAEKRRGRSSHGNLLTVDLAILDLHAG